jgi:cyanophycinase
MRGVLDRGGVVGGSSAGATILGSFMVRGDSRGSHIMIASDDPAHLVAFGYLRDTAIDQHWRARGREYDMVEVIQLRPELLGISIDEGTAVVVIGDQLELLGSDCIGIYHTGTLGNALPYEMYCDVGQRYDLANRVPIP